jgi:C-terminal processing protease CtpA/Prc
MHTFLQPLPSDGRIIEGQGVLPDIERARDRQELLAGRDNQLEAARVWIKAHPAT